MSRLVTVDMSVVKRYPLLRAPWWVLAVVTGTFFGLFMGLFGYISDRGHVGEHIVTGLIGGVVFGAIMGPYLSRQNRRALVAAGDDRSFDEQVDVLKIANGRMPPPADPHLRESAAAVLRQRLALLRRQRIWSVIVFGLALVLELSLAITESPWWLLAAALFAGFLALTWVAPRRAQRRLAELESGLNG